LIYESQVNLLSLPSNMNYISFEPVVIKENLANMKVESNTLKMKCLMTEIRAETRLD